MKRHDVIKLLLKRKGITQKELSKNIGISQTAISLILTGANNPSDDTFAKISTVLEVPIAIINYMTLSEKDIPESKREIFRILNPSMEAFLKEMFNI